MSRPDLFTYTGALRILGKYERPSFEKFDMALGGAILAGAVVGGSDVLGLIDRRPARVRRRERAAPQGGHRVVVYSDPRRVSTSGSSSVMAIVCSEWAVREPSADRIVQPSSS